MQFKNKSKDTLNHLSLHDCVINHAEWIGNSLVFHMDWIEVLKTNPLNTTGRAKNARNAVLIFEDAIEISCIYYDLTKAQEEGKETNKKSYNIPDDAEIIITSITECCKDVEISQDEQNIENGQKIWTCLCQNDSEFKISYSTMWVCFNDFDKDSWFEF